MPTRLAIWRVRFLNLPQPKRISALLKLPWLLPSKLRRDLSLGNGQDLPTTPTRRSGINGLTGVVVEASKEEGEGDHHQSKVPTKEEICELLEITLATIC